MEERSEMNAIKRVNMSRAFGRRHEVIYHLLSGAQQSLNITFDDFIFSFFFLQKTIIVPILAAATLMNFNARNWQMRDVGGGYGPPHH